MAPFVKLGSSVIFDPGTFTNPDYENLQSRAYRDGMRISSNSWGAATGGAYTSDAQRYDALVRDAQPAASAVPAAGNQEMVIVFAAGNCRLRRQHGRLARHREERHHRGRLRERPPLRRRGPVRRADTDANDSAMDIIAFSSRGPHRGRPQEAGHHGPRHARLRRRRPGELASNPPAGTGQALAASTPRASAPARAPATSGRVGQQWYTASSGTSHSTPAVAGGAALVRQYFINQGLAAAEPGDDEGLPDELRPLHDRHGRQRHPLSNNQGMGLMDLGMAFDGIPRTLDGPDRGQPLHRHRPDAHLHRARADDPTKPFRVTLAWTDAPGSTTGSAWKNNLDLR